MAKIYSLHNLWHILDKIEVQVLVSGPWQAVGAALALKDGPITPVAVLGDRDFLMGSSAFWTAAKYRLPLLVVVANNASFFNDEVHQEPVARARTRPVENKWIE